MTSANDDELAKKLSHLSPEQLKLLRKRLAAAEKREQADDSIPRVERGSDGLPLSLVQQSYWFLDQLEGGSATYNVPSAFRIQGQLDEKVLEQSLRLIIKRHEVLRTIFRQVDDAPRQFVLTSWDFSLNIDDVSNLSSDEREKEASRLVHAEAQKAFNLETDLLLRARLVRLADDEHILAITIHHIAYDGWSAGLFMSEFVTSYEALSRGAEPQLPELPVQYGDYAAWQEQTLTREKLGQQLEFWRQRLSGLAPLLSIPTDRPRPARQSYRGDVEAIDLSADLSKRLSDLAREQGATLFMLLTSALAVLLGRYANTDDVVIGTATANRDKPELSKMIGFFANTLVLRFKVDDQESYREYLDRIRKESLEAYANQDLPFDQVVDAVHPERSLSIPPVFQVHCVLQNAHTQQKIDTGSSESVPLVISPVESNTSTAKLDLNLFLYETPDGLVATMEYATDLFDADTIKSMLEHYQNLLTAIAANPDEQIAYLPILGQKEIDQVRDWNTTDEIYPQDQCIHHLFEEQVAATPDKTAYVVAGESFTYRELNERANRIASFLRERGVGPEVRVGLFVKRSSWMGIGALGVFKSHGTYVPLDPNYPADRLEHMLDVTTPQVILTQTEMVEKLPPTSAEIICLDGDENLFAECATDNPAHLDHAEHSAYVLFTSGSTGKPKGILVAHKSFRNMANAHRWMDVVNDQTRILQFASLSFSISLWGSFMAWLGGGTLYQVVDEEGLPEEPLFKLLREERINTVTWPVSLLSTFPEVDLPDLKTVISSAEPCTDAVVEKWSGDGRRFMNMYGNSEVSIGSTVYEYREEGQILTIGRAMPNTQMYLLDKNLQQVPVGVTAEIFTGGAGLARGYLNRPEATAEKFIPNPFSDHPGERLYRTGDLGRYLPNGEIEFFGRDDFQVSIRGFRIELTEIEDILRDIEEIDDVAVVARPDPQGVDRLVCYAVAKEAGAELKTAYLRQVVGEQLPNYMVPSIFVQLDKMPLTPNRKVDRLSLPVPDMASIIEKEYIAPETPEQKELAEIWSDVLTLEKVGIQNNFFEIGGHSLLATRVVSKIRDKHGVTMPVRLLFEYPTIEELANRIIELKALTAEPEPAADDEDSMEIRI